MSLFERKRPELSRDQAFLSVPVPNRGVRALPADSGEAILLVIRRPPLRPEWLERFAPVVRERRIELDDIGSQVWTWIDGQRTVRSLCRTFAETFDVNRREAEVAVAEFLKSLMKRGVISMQIPGDRHGPGEIAG